MSLPLHVVAPLIGQGTFSPSIIGINFTLSASMGHYDTASVVAYMKIHEGGSFSLTPSFYGGTHSRRARIRITNKSFSPDRGDNNYRWYPIGQTPPESGLTLTRKGSFLSTTAPAGYLFQLITIPLTHSGEFIGILTISENEQVLKHLVVCYTVTISRSLL